VGVRTTFDPHSTHRTLMLRRSDSFSGIGTRAFVLDDQRAAISDSISPQLLKIRCPYPEVRRRASSVRRVSESKVTAAEIIVLMLRLLGHGKPPPRQRYEPESAQPTQPDPDI
jgi:hypothetical protein